MHRPQNYSVTVGLYGEIAECDNYTCHHCQRIVFVPVGKSAYEVGGGCRLCGHLICSACVDKGACRPWEEQMLAVERRYEAQKMVSRLVGR